MTGLWSSLASVTPDQKGIPRQNNSNKTPAVSILRNDPILEAVATGKMSQGDYLLHP